VELVSQIRYRFRLGYSADLLEQTFPVLSLFFRLIKEERFRLKIVNCVDFSCRIVDWTLLHVDDTSLLQVFEVEVGVA
jgi:hypothetical protein